MRTLQRFSELKVSEVEMQGIKGGQAVSGSGTIFGSNYSYAGSFSPTAGLSQTATLSVGVASYSQTTPSYTSDWCGSVSIDGSNGGGCMTFFNGSWHVMTM